ncbi:hypothetical protein DFH06DRAFT_1132194 [Mycena polygramma]|nr:hypothetical protein DFH06DRAFT_1132194 [Mycena polygramma]
MASPAIPRISLKTPPPSPGPSRITLAPTDDRIISPVKQSRTVLKKSTHPGRAIGPVKKRARVDTWLDSTEFMPAQHAPGPQPSVYEQTIEAEAAHTNSHSHYHSHSNSNSEMNTEMDTEMDDTEDKGYSEYIDSVLEDGTAFFQVSESLFVVNGWDSKRMCSKDTWYHIQRSTIGSETIYVCTCPGSNADGICCVHEHLLKEYGTELFPVDNNMLTDSDEVVLFSRQIDLNDENVYLNHFSCPSSNKRGLSGRVIVTYDGSDEGSGRWNCEKDNSSPCSHVGVCRAKFGQLVGIVPGADTDKGPVPNEPDRYLFRPLDQAAISKRTATIYGLSEPFSTTLELQSCPCKRRFIGPDCASFGIFNYNNKALFTHEILDEYIAAFTTSETPFSAWILVVSRRYALRGTSFCSSDTFRSAWFAYAKLLYLEGDMCCQKCGPCPENTIWDGVTLAFNKKHLLPSLEPPTISQDASIIRDKTQYISSQQALPDSVSRKIIRKVIIGPPLLMGAGLDSSEDEVGEEEDEEDTQPSKGTSKSSKKKTELIERLEAIPVAISRLAGTHLPLSKLFTTHFGEAAVVTSVVAPDVYKRFFFQISAEESILQMINANALTALDRFVANPCKPNATALIDIPTVHEMLIYEFGLNQPLSVNVLDVCRWLSERGKVVFGWLRKDLPSLPRTPACVEKPWSEVFIHFDSIG